MLMTVNEQKKSGRLIGARNFASMESFDCCDKFAKHSPKLFPKPAPDLFLRPFLRLLLNHFQAISNWSAHMSQWVTHEIKRQTSHRQHR